MVRKFLKFIRSGLKKFSGSSHPQHEESVRTLDAIPDNAQPETSQKKRRRRKKKTSSEPSAVLIAPLVKEKWDLSEFEVTPAEGKARFHDFNLPHEIMHAISDMGFEYCTPIQAESLPVTLEGNDAIGQAQTGTGKTAAFLITILTDLIRNRHQNQRPNGKPHSLILAPTRELVIQIAKDADALSRYANINVVSVYGGIDYQKQQNQIIDKTVDMVVATPGRLLDFIGQRILNLDQVKFLVIDEADRMLDMGFIPDVRKIVNSTPHKDKRQTMMFSATITSDVSHLASQWTKKPVIFEIKPEQVTVDTVQQVVYLTTAKEKYTLLYNTIMNNNLERVMVFTNRKDETRRLTERLKRNEISCEMISGDVSQNKRISTLEDFRNGKIRILVATDVAGRGIHIDGVTHVINYTLPYEPEDYVHRIGRTGRAGASGTSISFACEEGAFYIPEIEAYIGAKLPCVTPDADLLVDPPRGTGKPEKEPFRSPKGGSWKNQTPGRRRPSRPAHPRGR
ncbi:MAG: ATP-dependent RNA helicase RhlB [Proteobacteria bacterium]|nr:ATP-dependent RNA helicase RhlB [Pseudomonadota bacterium]MBU1687618.1 ATP-dependent RNA helicase RhlB [Pseudomonadota bacterium]